jgi:hypothetical protein
LFFKGFVLTHIDGYSSLSSTQKKAWPFGLCMTFFAKIHVTPDVTAKERGEKRQNKRIWY